MSQPVCQSVWPISVVYSLYTCGPLDGLTDLPSLRLTHDARSHVTSITSPNHSITQPLTHSTNQSPNH
jgi:hypothetical protein